MNITGGSNLSLFEVQEAADIVASASDEEVNMIFGSVINENLNDEIIVTVIATGFSEDVISQQQRQQNSRPMGTVRGGQTQQPQVPIRVRVQEQQQQQQNVQHEPQRQAQQLDDLLDIPTFLRNRRNRG
jgi:cell division protein FtsZ